MNSLSKQRCADANAALPNPGGGGTDARSTCRYAKVPSPISKPHRPFEADQRGSPGSSSQTSTVRTVQLSPICVGVTPAVHRPAPAPRAGQRTVGAAQNSGAKRVSWRTVANTAGGPQILRVSVRRAAPVTSAPCSPADSRLPGMTVSRLQCRKRRQKRPSSARSQGA